MIRIGYRDEHKIGIINKYIKQCKISKTIIISPDKFTLQHNNSDLVTYADTIEYPTFYRLLQEINLDTLIVLNECLRTQNRYDLTYNCIRHFLSQTKHTIVFQQLPQIDKRDDFMILFDFDTQSRWKQYKFDINMILDHSDVKVQVPEIKFNKIDIPTSKKTSEKYKRERQQRFNNLDTKDPHTIPRNLHLIGGVDKKAYIRLQTLPLFTNVIHSIYVARNQRLAMDNVVNYRNVKEGSEISGIVDFTHRFIEFSDLIKITWQFEFNVLTTSLKVDQWYFNRYDQWSKRINETCASLQQ